MADTAPPSTLTMGSPSGRFEHVTVLRDAVVAMLESGPAGLVVDCTLGGGGHSEALLEAREDWHVLGLDRDEQALAAARDRLARFGRRFTAVHAPFSSLGEVLDARGQQTIAGLVADLGVSSHQLDVPERGFSFRTPGPLDMRMDTSRGAPLRERLEGMDVRELADVLYAYGDVRASIRAAKAVLYALADGVDDTAALAERIARRLPKRGRIHPATQVFQALRIWVNDELGELDALLDVAPTRLAPDATMAVISFHSGEDRQVKQRFRVLGPKRGGAFAQVRRSVAKPGAAEQSLNPRARSARLRGLTRLGEPEGGLRGEGEGEPRAGRDEERGEDAG